MIENALEVIKDRTAERNFEPSSFGTLGLLTFVVDENPEVNLPE
jgi:hypothetical protein